MKGRTSVGRGGVSAGQHIDAFAALMSTIGPQSFCDDDATLQSGEKFRVKHHLTTFIADLHTRAFLDANALISGR